MSLPVGKQSTHLSPLYKIIIFGKTGVGKSACGNSILGKNAFVFKKSFKPVTQQVQMDSVIFDGEIFHVYDTPGLFDPEKSKENLKQLESLLQHDETVCTVVLLVIKADKMTSEDEEAANLIEDFIPEHLIRNSWILFTRGDELEREDLTIEEFIEDTDELKRIVERFENRYHVFNNFSPSPDQVRSLITKIKETAEIIAPEILAPLDPKEDPLYRRIVLVGKSGYGKSATGNTILGEKRFRSEISSNSVTVHCEIETAVVIGRNLSVIDTPGLFNTIIENPEELAKEIGKSIYLSAPGPHAFLYVQPINRFTEEEDVLQKVKMIFGEGMRKYMIILFTHGDLLKRESTNIDSEIQKNKSLSKVIDQCGGGYLIFNNKDQRRKHQVTELLHKIDRMVEQNGESFYTYEMFREAEKHRQKKKLNKQRVKAFCKSILVFVLFGTIGGFVARQVGTGAGIGAGIGAATGAVIVSYISSLVSFVLKARSKPTNEQEGENAQKKDA